MPFRIQVSLSVSGLYYIRSVADVGIQMTGGCWPHGNALPVVCKQSGMKYVFKKDIHTQL